MNERNAPRAQVILVFGVLSIPLALLRHLCSLAVVLGVLAIVLHLWTRWRMSKGAVYTADSVRLSTIGGRLAIAGTCIALVMWVLWATNVLLD